MGATIADVAGFASGIVDNVFGFVNNERTNETNKDINANTLQQQRELTTQSQEWQSKENQIAREWNSPVTQKLLYEQAGINPYISESGQISAGGATSTGAASAAAAPQIAMQPFRSNFRSMFENMLNAKSVDANANSQRAQAFASFVSTIPTLSRYLGSDAVKQMFHDYMPAFIGNDYKNSQEFRLVELQIEAQDYANGISLVEKKVQEKYSDETAYNKMRNLSQQLVESVTHVGLMNSLAKLNEANVNRNEAEIKYYQASVREALSRCWSNLQQGNYYKELGISEHDFRQYTASSLALGLVNQSLDTIQHTSEFKGKEWARELMDSDWFKMSQAYGLMVDNSMLGKTLDFFTKEIGNIVGCSPKLSKPNTPYGLNYIKVRETKPTFNGKKIGEYWLPRE